MRIIKLSPNDTDMRTREKVDRYFQAHLAKRRPVGQFLLTERRIAANGIRPGELLVFSYNGEIVYLARSRSGRENTVGPDAIQYPYYFCVEMGSIQAVNRRLIDLEKLLHSHRLFGGNVVRTQGWPRIDDSGSRGRLLEKLITRFVAQDNFRTAG